MKICAPRHWNFISLESLGKQKHCYWQIFVTFWAMVKTWPLTINQWLLLTNPRIRERKKVHGLHHLDWITSYKLSSNGYSNPYIHGVYTGIPPINGLINRPVFFPGRPWSPCWSSADLFWAFGLLPALENACAAYPQILDGNSCWWHQWNICYLPPFMGTRNNHWLRVWNTPECQVPQRIFWHLI